MLKNYIAMVIFHKKIILLILSVVIWGPFMMSKNPPLSPSTRKMKENILWRPYVHLVSMWCLTFIPISLLFLNTLWELPSHYPNSTKVQLKGHQRKYNFKIPLNFFIGGITFLTLFLVIVKLHVYTHLPMSFTKVQNEYFLCCQITNTFQPFFLFIIQWKARSSSTRSVLSIVLHASFKLFSRLCNFISKWLTLGLPYR